MTFKELKAQYDWDKEDYESGDYKLEYGIVFHISSNSQRSITRKK
jgi:hypothetical protein